MQRQSTSSHPPGNAPFPGVVIFVADVQRMTKFYQSVAQMRRISGDDDHTVLEIAGFQLVVHALKGEPAPPPNGPVTPRDDSYLKVCLPVASISQARDAASLAGGHIKPPRHEWEARGFRACDGHDPEGNIIQVRQTAP